MGRPSDLRDRVPCGWTWGLLKRVWRVRHMPDAPVSIYLPIDLTIYFFAYGLPPSAFEMSVIAFCARTLLPASSSGGDTTAMPNLPGETAMRPPPTPLLPGSPVR